MKHDICPACETMSHCMKKGCIPITPERPPLTVPTDLSCHRTMTTQEKYLEILPAGANNVADVRGGWSGAYRKQPCGGCPWRKDQIGTFDPLAFCHSAKTAEKDSMRVFACHESGIGKPAVCAGFAMRGAEHNASFKEQVERGFIDPAQITDGGLELHTGYRSMSELNGVSPDDPALAPTMLSSFERPPLQTDRAPHTVDTDQA